MRLLTLDLAAYGPFTDVGLDFTASDTGLHLIYGPNEAGKSTALRAVHALLFGVEVRTRDNFLHAKPGSLRIGGALENAAGQRIRIVRRKGRKDTLLNPDHPESAPHADEALAPFLAGIDKHGFARIFAIGHEELREGGGELQELRGLVGESLFASASGGPRLTRLMASLSEQASALFVPRGKCKIRESVKDYKLLTEQRKAAEMRIPTWEKLTSARDAARKSHELSAERLKQLRTEAHRLDRMQQAVANLQERDRLLINKQSLARACVLPQEYSSEDRTQCQSQASMLDRTIQALTDQLNGPGGVQEQLSGLTVAADILEHAEEIAALQEERGVIVKAESQRTQRERDRDRLLNHIASLLQEVQSSGATTSTVPATSDPDAMISAAEQLRLPTNHIVAIRSLANDEQLLRKESRDKHREWERLTSRLAENEHDLQTLGPLRHVTELEATLTIARKAAGIDDRVSSLEAGIASGESAAHARLHQLGAWTGDLDQVLLATMPLRSTVDRFDEQWTSLQNRRDAALAETTQAEKDLAATLREIETVQRTEATPTQEELRKARGERDQAWEEIQAAWLSQPNEPRPACDPPRLAERLTKTIRESDHLADRLRREADRVALLARRQAEVTELQSNLRRLSVLQEQYVIESSEYQQSWLAVWQPVGVDQPRTPKEMAAWLEQFGELKRDVKELETLRSSRKTLLRERDALRTSLVNGLRTLTSVDADDGRLDTLLVISENVVRLAREENRIRTDLADTIRELRGELPSVEIEKQQADEALTAWQKKWNDAMRSIGCPLDAPGSQANQRITQLEQLWKATGDLHELTCQIGQATDDAESFAQRVHELCGRAAPELIELPAPEAATALRRRLEDAKKTSVLQVELQSQQEQRSKELHDAQQEYQRVANRLAQLCALAKVDSHESLATVEAESEAFATCCERLEALESQLNVLTDDGQISSIVTEIDGRSADELAAEAAAIDDQIRQVEQEYQDAYALLHEREQSLQAADGGSDAAEADQKALDILSNIQTDAEMYIKYCLASAMLREQIERHRAENQDPLLQRATQLFRELTCGAYTRLRTEYNEQDLPYLVGVRAATDTCVDVDGMSDGTRDQLYLALRLAYIYSRIAKSEPLPFIVDDILVHFDNERAAATLRVLAELSRHTQVLFFTHHEHLLSLATESLKADEFAVHFLDHREESKEPAVVADGRVPR